MSRVAIESTDYAGRISRPPWQVPYATFSCLRCGSNLYGRREKTRSSNLRHPLRNPGVQVPLRIRAALPTEGGMNGPM